MTSTQIKAFTLFKYMLAFSYSMSEEPFLLVSLEETKAKTLAQVLSNDTSRKILDFLSRKEHATETEISKEMKIPLSTAHYNLDLLVKAELVSNENFTYSEKGKQIVHYSLSNRYVIIAPRKTDALKEKIKQFLPVVLVIGLASFAVKIFSRTTFNASPQLMSAASPVLEARMADAGEDVAMKALSQPAQPLLQTQEFAVWFLFGSVFALIVYFIWAEVILKKIKKRQ